MKLALLTLVLIINATLAREPDFTRQAVVYKVDPKLAQAIVGGITNKKGQIFPTKLSDTVYNLQPDFDSRGLKFEEGDLLILDTKTNEIVIVNVPYQIELFES